MRGLNRVTLIGNVGKDPETKILEGNLSVCRLSLATTETYRLANGESRSETLWHTIVLWRGLAELASKYVKQGSLLYVDGKINYRSYEEPDGQKKYVTEIIGENIIFLDKRQD